MDHAKQLTEQLLYLRKKNGLTQEALAERLGVTYQAVSKWENGQSCPDIALLPQLADVYGVTIDSLFGRGSASVPAGMNAEPVFSYCDALPWPDDQTLRGVVAWGRKLLGYSPVSKEEFTLDVSESQYTWLLRYSPLNVSCACGLHVEGDVQGNASAGNNIRCRNIGGDANAEKIIKA